MTPKINQYNAHIKITGATTNITTVLHNTLGTITVSNTRNTITLTSAADLLLLNRTQVLVSPQISPNPDWVKFMSIDTGEITLTFNEDTTDNDELVIQVNVFQLPIDTLTENDTPVTP